MPKKCAKKLKIIKNKNIGPKSSKTKLLSDKNGVKKEKNVKKKG